MPSSILIVGAGVTGSVLARLLAAQAPGLAVTVWEHAAGPGGRFSTHYLDDHPSGTGPLVDLGAQYISKGAGREPDNSLYAALVEAGVLQPFDGLVDSAHESHGTKDHFVSRRGMASIPAHLLMESKASVFYGRTLTSVRLEVASQESTDSCDAEEKACAGDGGASRSQQQPARWVARDASGKEQAFDALALTMPLPNLAEVSGDEAWAGLLAPLRAGGLLPAAGATAAAGSGPSRYSKRFALACYYESEAWEAEPLRGVEWASKYVGREAQCEALRYVSIEPRKRQLAKDASVPALLLHSSVPYAIEAHKQGPASIDHSDVEKTLLADLQKVLPGLPPPTRCYLKDWAVSQAGTPKEGSLPEGAKDGAMLLLQEQQEQEQGEQERVAIVAPPVVLAGDGFVGSNFDNCAFSARVAGSKLLAALGAGSATRAANL